MMARTAGAIAPSSYRLRSQASSSHRRAVELVSRSICSPPKSPLARPLEVGLQGRRQPCLEALGVAVAVGFEPTKIQAGPLPVFKTGAFNRSATPPEYENAAPAMGAAFWFSGFVRCGG